MAAFPLLCLILTAAVRGQSALDGFNPVPNGPVDVAVVQPDGKILIGGRFTTISPNGGGAVTRNRIARLNPDGTLDTAFNPDANSSVYAIALQPDGKILVGGVFSTIGGQARYKIARLDGTTGLADSFDPNPSGGGSVTYVFSIAVQADGKVLTAGVFSAIGGQPRNFIARLDGTTGLADSFDPNANADVTDIALQADGKILVSGAFTSIGGQPRRILARLDPTTGLADSFDPNPSSWVYSIALQADGKILVAGNFSSVGGQQRNSIARLDPSTGLADSFDPNANSSVGVIAVQADGRILAGGLFTGVGGQSRIHIARLDPTTGLADSFKPNANDIVRSIAVQADGKILAGGDFTSIAGQGPPYLARLETDGRLDRTLNLGLTNSLVLATAIQPDGKILVGGDFHTVLGVTRNLIARLNTDGTLDTAFDPNGTGNHVRSIVVQADGRILVGGLFTGIGGQTRNNIARIDGTIGLADSFDPHATSTADGGNVNSIAVQTDGKVLAGGLFRSIGGQSRNRIARLDANTGLADSFDPNASNDVIAVAVQADGEILVGGVFSSIGGQTRNYFTRLDSTTGLADSLDPHANGPVFSITVQPDSKILIGGSFSGINGSPRNRIGRLDATTGLPDSFNPNANDIVNAIAVQADGKVLVGGWFNGPNSIGGQLRNRIARLDGTTGLADSFDPNAGSNVFSIALQTDGKILVGGTFNSIGGQPRRGLARLSNDIAASQDLAVTQTTITWTRGGSSPQFGRVTFEYSTDNGNYIFLGDGTAAGSNWVLNGLDFPTGQSFYVRARGYYHTDYNSGSESIAESVRSAFLSGPIATPSPTPAPTPTPSPTPTPTPTDTVWVDSAVYTNGNHMLRVRATDSIKSNARGAPVLHVYVTSTGALIGDLSGSSDGTYGGDLPYPENPAVITVRSSLGGHADMAVVVGRDPR